MIFQTKKKLGIFAPARCSSQTKKDKCSDLFCLQKTGQVYVRVHVITYQRKTIITTVVQIVREKILNDKLKIIMILP